MTNAGWIRRCANRRQDGGSPGRTSGPLAARATGRFLGGRARSPDGGSPPAGRRRASPARRGGASRASCASRCDRGRARSWRSRSRPRSPSGSLRPDQHLDRGTCRAPGGEERQARSARLRRISRPRVHSPGCPHRTRPPRGPPVPGRPSRTAADPWCRHRPRDAPTPQAATLSRSSPPCRPPGLLAPGPERMRAGDAEHVALARPAQRVSTSPTP